MAVPSLAISRLKKRILSLGSAIASAFVNTSRVSLRRSYLSMKSKAGMTAACNCASQTHINLQPDDNDLKMGAEDVSLEGTTCFMHKSVDVNRC